MINLCPERGCTATDHLARTAFLPDAIVGCWWEEGCFQVFTGLADGAAVLAIREIITTPAFYFKVLLYRHCSLLL